jgi:hypothetical protein
MQLGLRLGLTAARGAGGGGGGPVNLALPEITGLLTQGADLTFDVGLWSGTVDTFEIEVTQTSPTATLLARQTVTGTTTGTVTADVGGSLTLNVWATGPGGETLASSAAFGPIEAAGDEWVMGLVFNPSTGHNPTPSGSPVTWTLAAPDPAAQTYAAIAAWATATSYVVGNTRRQGGYVYTCAVDHTSGTFATDLASGYWTLTGPSWGWVGSNAASTTTDFDAQAGKGDVRLNGRYGINGSPAQIGIQIDLPDGPGIYIIHAGLSANSTVVPRMEVRDGGSAATVLRTFNAAAASVTSAQVIDAADNITTVAGWQAASDYGGAGFEVTASGNSLWFGRPTTSGSPWINCIAVLKKAA